MFLERQRRTGETFGLFAYKSKEIIWVRAGRSKLVDGGFRAVSLGALFLLKPTPFGKDYVAQLTNMFRKARLSWVCFLECSTWYLGPFGSLWFNDESHEIH